MRRHSGYYTILLCLFLGMVPEGRAHTPAVCIAPSQLIPTAVRISTADHSGSGVFISPRHLATVEHVATAVARQDAWTTVRLDQMVMWQGRIGHGAVVPIRIVTLVSGDEDERLAILELRDTFSGFQTALVAEEVPAFESYVSGVGYPRGQLTTVGGVYVGNESVYAPPRTFTAHYLELSERDNWEAFGLGASGAPVFDCSGRLVFLVSSQTWSAHNSTCSDIDDGVTTRCKDRRRIDYATNRGIPAIKLRAFLQSAVNDNE